MSLRTPSNIKLPGALPPAVKSTNSADAKQMAKTTSHPFKESLGMASKAPQDSKAESESSSLDSQLNVLGLDSHLQARHNFLNDAAGSLGVSPFSLLPIEEHRAGIFGASISAGSLHNELDAHNLLKGMMGLTLGNAHLLTHHGHNSNHSDAPSMTPPGSSLEHALLDAELNTTLKQAMRNLKVGKTLSHLTGTAVSLKNSILDLGDRWSTELSELEFASDSPKEFKVLSVNQEHSPSEQLRAAVQAVANQQDTFVGSELSGEGFSSGLSGFSLNGTLSQSPLAEVRQPSMALQVAMASHMDIELPQFSTQLKRLSIKIQDPAGVMMLEIVKEAQELHVRAVIPPEAMNDMNNVEADVRHQLKQQGLELGSFEMYSQSDNNEGHEQRGHEAYGEEAEAPVQSQSLKTSILDTKI